MRKRTLAIILTAVLCVGLLPANVLAETEQDVADEEIESIGQDAAGSDEDVPEESGDAGLSVVQEETEDEAITGEEPDPDIAPLAYTGDGTGQVVLSLGNGNGIYNFADYSGNRQEGTLLRYTTDSLKEYAEEDGSLTIHLPSDNDLDNIFTVVDADTVNDLGAVTVELGSDMAYDYKLIGWVNIATRDYYDVSGGATTAKINLADENVFYADWIAASYDHGSSGDDNLRDDTVSTKDFVTIHMYDYNDLFNLYSESVEQNVEMEGIGEASQTATVPESWTDSGELHSSRLGNDGITNSFLFVNNGTTGYTPGQGLQKTGGMLSWPNNKTDGDTWTGSGSLPRDAKEQWGITSPSSAPLNMLFDTSASSTGVHYVGEADHLFWIDEDGYYTYNSKTNAAVYNQSDGRFYVYDESQDVNGTEFSCFLPFNDFKEVGNNVYSALDGTVNYWFGMDMEVNFYLPAAAGSGANLVNGENMVFNFSGDDDILIFIDDELALDMSGIHDESFGSIDFTEGTLTMGMSADADGNIEDGTTTDFNLSSGNHDLKIYYLERGGYASNLEVQFNVVPLWDYETGDVQTVTAEKVWKDSDGKTIDPKNLNADYAKSVEVGLFDALGEATDDTFGYTKNGTEYTVTYADDQEITHTYVYDSAGPSLTYTEKGTTVVYSQTNASGQVIDDEGYVIAWLDGETLHIRIDEQTLSDDNHWSYAWELLDVTGDYEVLELSESSHYTTETTKKNLTSHKYWSIIGDQEIEENLSRSDFTIVLTDAAQQASGTVGDTSEAKGWVIVGTTSGIQTQEVLFSQIATLIPFEQDDTTYYAGTYGVTSQNEIKALGDGAIWYVKDSGNQEDDSSGGTVEGFYLYCVLNGTNYYLTVDEANNTLTTTTSSSAASEFYYDSLGELRIAREGNDRVIISTDGQVGLDVAEFEAATNDGRVYSLTETTSSGFAATITNTVDVEEKTGTGTGSGTSGTGQNPGTVKTSDPNNIALWVILLAASGAVMGTTEMRRIRLRRKEK